VGRYALVKIGLALPTALVVAALVFFAMRVLPGDVALNVLGENATPTAIAAFRHNAGLDQPLAVQFLTYMGGLVHGDLGKSMTSGRPVAELYGAVLPYTIDLVVASLATGIPLGVLLGSIAAARRGTTTDTSIRLLASATIATPTFYLGIVLLAIFGLTLRWVPAIGGGELSDPIDRLRHLALPALTIAVLLAGRLARITRTALAEVLGLDYIRTAYGKGLSGQRVLRTHALRNGLISIATVTGVYFAGAAAGSIIVETVFTRPGVGRLLIGAIGDRDYTIVQSGLLLYALLIVFVNLIVDLSIPFIDPRLRTEYH
jgi:peptide/nickel transport system permease protein